LRNPERITIVNAWQNECRQSDRCKPSHAWIPLFRDVSASAVDAILAYCEVLRLPADTHLLKPGEINHNVYILLSGELIARIGSDLNSAILISPGECVGEMSVIDGKPVSALVQAHTEVRVLVLPRDLFLNRLMALPGVAANLMITLTGRMRRSNEQALKAQRDNLELQHLRKELDVARQLQASMLPLQNPLFPERTDIEACGLMEPASNIGGDLFDIFFVNEHHLFFCIGDVSGHGIAAALFMARTIGLLRILAMNIWAPDKLLETLNDRLCIGNDANIFVTLFCGFIDVRSGKLRYSNGGHCPPILSAGGQGRLLELPKGALIGAFPGISYATMELNLRQGDLLFCYTDGITEAQNSLGIEFSEQRCLQMLNLAETASLPVLLNKLRLEVSNFTGVELLDDDCTMLAIRLGTSTLSG
jgi:phosphoserine phosphatase RsbU/P